MSETEPTAPLFDEFPAVTHQEWKEEVRSDLGGADPDDFLSWSSLEGISVSAYLDHEVLSDLPHVAPDATAPPLAVPADRPANAWTLSQSLTHPDPERANQHARTAVENGVDALDVSVSPPGATDHGLSVCRLEDFATILDGIDLAETELHLGRGLATPGLYVLLQQVLTERALTPETLRGSIAFDPVATLASGITPSPEQAFALADQLTEDAEDARHLRSVSIDARPYHDAGASAMEELAAMLAALTERLTRSTEQGHPLPALLDDLHFIVPVSTSYFVELAKLRALRLLVPQVVEAFAAETDTRLDYAATDLHIHAETSRRTETIYDPYVNMLRATTEAMAAVLGGCDVLTVRPYDTALRPPDDFGLRIARNTQLILEHEAHFDRVADPAAGSYYVETLTDELAEGAWEQFQSIEAKGGIVETLRNGTLQRQIAETREQRRDAIDHRKRVLVGTTHYPNLDEQRRDDLTTPSEDSSSRGSTPLSSPSLDAIRTACQNEAPLPQITSTLRTEEAPIPPLPRIRIAEEIEALRLRTEAYAEAHEGPPRVLLVPLGPPAARSARATFARNFLGVAGFEIEEPLKFDSVDEAATAAVEQSADVVVLCSSNADYADLAPALASALADREHDALLGIAGAPDDIETDADVFVHQDSSLTEVLTALQERLGISREHAS